MSKINLDFPIKDIEGNELKETTAGRELAKVMQYVAKENEKSVDPIKIMAWCEKLYGGEELDLDLSDLQILKAVVRSCGLFNFVSAPIMKVLIKAE